MTPNKPLIWPYLGVCMKVGETPHAKVGVLAMFDLQWMRIIFPITKAAKTLGLSKPTMNKFCNIRTPCTPDIAQKKTLSIDSNVAAWINL